MRQKKVFPAGLEALAGTCETIGLQLRTEDGIGLQKQNSSLSLEKQIIFKRTTDAFIVEPMEVNYAS